MRVLELWRHPIKSMLGERLTVADIDGDGLRYDRAWGIVDLAGGRVLTARREPALLAASARVDEAGEPVITLPSGQTAVGRGRATDLMLSSWIGRPVSLVAATEVPAGTAEFFEDATDDTSRAIPWSMPPGRFVDALPLLVLTTASLRRAQNLYPGGQWDTRRFRANVVIETAEEGWVEDAWHGRSVMAGGVVIRPVQGCTRCTMVTRAQPGLSRDLDIYRTLAGVHGGTFGVWSRVSRAGTLAVGDPVTVA